MADENLFKKGLHQKHYSQTSSLSNPKQLHKTPPRSPLIQSPFNTSLNSSFKSRQISKRSEIAQKSAEKLKEISQNSKLLHPQTNKTKASHLRSSKNSKTSINESFQKLKFTGANCINSINGINNINSLNSLNSLNSISSIQGIQKFSEMSSLASSMKENDFKKLNKERGNKYFLTLQDSSPQIKNRKYATFAPNSSNSKNSQHLHNSKASKISNHSNHSSHTNNLNNTKNVKNARNSINSGNLVNSTQSKTVKNLEHYFNAFGNFSPEDLPNHMKEKRPKSGLEMKDGVSGTRIRVKGDLNNMTFDCGNSSGKKNVNAGERTISANKYNTSTGDISPNPLLNSKSTESLLSRINSQRQRAQLLLNNHNKLLAKANLRQSPFNINNSPNSLSPIKQVNLCSLFSYSFLFREEF